MFCRPARDTLLFNRSTEKLNFDTNYVTMNNISSSFIIKVHFLYVWQDGSYLAELLLSKGYMVCYCLIRV